MKIYLYYAGLRRHFMVIGVLDENIIYDEESLCYADGVFYVQPIGDFLHATHVRHTWVICF